MNAPIRLKEPNAAGRQYTINLSFGGMAALLTALTLSLTLFFVLGVLVGRGHRPESAVPVVAGLMPRETVARPAPAAEVLKPEELGYGEQLGKKHEGPAPARPIDKVERGAPEKKAEAKTDKTAEKKDAPKDPKKDEKKPGDKKTEQKPDPDTQRYDYAYQAASFPDMDQAKAFLKRVKGLGLKGDIESGNTGGKAWHRVVVFFQGTPTDTRALKDKLSGLGVQKPVMRSKTPI
jgi:cell division protein FtsN